MSVIVPEGTPVVSEAFSRFPRSGERRERLGDNPREDAPGQVRTRREAEQGVSSIDISAESSVAGGEQSSGHQYGQRKQQSQKGNQETEEGEAEDFARSDAAEFLRGGCMTAQRFIALGIVCDAGLAPGDSRRRRRLT
jgi:hypothetical protein